MPSEPPLLGRSPVDFVDRLDATPEIVLARIEAAVSAAEILHIVREVT